VNIAVDNAEVISLRYEEITSALNKRFRDTESKTANSLQVGSYGRWTAIKGISDLDMLYIMPAGSWDTYYVEGGQSKLLSDTCKAIKARYPNTDVFVDRLVVRTLYTDFHIEVQPVFEQTDGNFLYPDTNGEGSWMSSLYCIASVARKKALLALYSKIPDRPTYEALPGARQYCWF
jgi:hypothetical protein